MRLSSAFLTLAACLWWAPPASAGGTPPPSAADDAEAAEERRLASELVLRRLGGAEAGPGGPEERALMVRMRRAEASGAVRYLRARLQTLAGLVVEQKVRGSRIPRLLLTREGFDRWLRLRTQETVAYLEKKGVAAKDVFQLRTPEGRPLFADSGVLTEEGEDFLARAEAGETLSWLMPSGELMWSRRRKPR